MKRVCKKCSKEKSIEDFASAGTVNGKEYRRHLCIGCYTDSKKPRRLAVRQQVIEYKKSMKCEKCGFDDHRALQFHHTSKKDFNVSDGIKRGLSWDSISEEIKKCQVLCANCHQIEHFPD